MNILFFAYWGLNDGLTASTVLPHLDILARDKRVEQIILCTIERDAVLTQQKLGEKVMHIPWMSSHQYIRKARDFFILPRRIGSLVKRFNVGLMICRGTLAGAIGYIVHRNTGIPYAVESFEPHAEYMRESRIWGRWDFRYLLQRHWETKQLQTAQFIIPVTKGYCDFLINQGIAPAKIHLMPCAVDLSAFAFNTEDRISIREALGLNEDVVVGIYVGKFGGLYFDKIAFHIFSLAKENFDKFYLIILSPDDGRLIRSKLLKAGYSPEEFHVQHTEHRAVPRYLSASDFAFGMYKPGHYKQFLSPIKIGEYWASGLPVLLTEGIGDDHLIIKALKIGSTFSIKDHDFQASFIELKGILSEGRTSINCRVQPVAAKYRSFAQTERVYYTILNALS